MKIPPPPLLRTPPAALPKTPPAPLATLARQPPLPLPGEPQHRFEVRVEGKVIGEVWAANGRGAYLAAIKKYNPDHRLALSLLRWTN